MNTTKRIHPYSFVPIRYNIVGNKRILESVLIFLSGGTQHGFQFFYDKSKPTIPNG